MRNPTNTSGLPLGGIAWRLLFILLLTAWFCPIVSAQQQPRLVKDINTQPSERPFCGIQDVGGICFFVLDTPDLGIELWKSDGTMAGTYPIKKFPPRSPAITLGNLTPLNGILFFTVNYSNYERELWRSDGTGRGTYLVSTIPAGETPLRACRGKILFKVNDYTTPQIWSSDGTPEGTAPIPAIPSWNYGDTFTTAQDRLFFATGAALWKTDATTAGTVLVKTLDSSYTIQSMATHQDHVYFLVRRFVSSSRKPGPPPSQMRLPPIIYYYDYDLWRSDGTPAGTAKVLHLNTYPDPVTFSQVSLGDTFYLALRLDLDNGPTYLYRFNPSGGVSGQVAYVNSYCQLLAPGGKLLLAAPGHLWHCETTSHTLRELKTDMDSEVDKTFCGAGNSLYFLNNGHELWQFNPATLNLSCNKDLTRTTGDFSAGQLVTSRGRLLFRAFNPAGTINLWQSDGTAAGTQVIKSMPTPTQSSILDFLPITWKGQLAFLRYSDDYKTSSDLWLSDGTPAGTRKAHAFLPLPDTDRLTNFRTFAELGNLWVCQAFEDRENWALWASDHTQAGTRKLASGFRLPYYSINYGFVPCGGKLYFQGIRNDAWYLWKTDGTPEGTSPILATRQPINDYGGLWASLAFNSVLYFNYSYNYSNTLWRTDGTEQGTWPMRDKNGSNLPPGYMVEYKGKIFIISRDDLWVSDGTAAGSHQLKVFGTPSVYNYGHQHICHDQLCFAVGNNLWRTDGTTTGTVQVAPVPYAWASATINGRIVFMCPNDNYASTLWVSDGTAAGTRRLKQFSPHSDDFVTESFTSWRGKLYFTVEDPVNGCHIWSTDGTENGTAMVSNGVAGNKFFVAGDNLYFIARDPFYGSEWWVMEPPPARAADWMHYR